MHLRSKAQLEKFASLVKEGKMSQEVFDAWLKETPNPSALPERVGPGKIGKVKKAKKI